MSTETLQILLVDDDDDHVELILRSFVHDIKKFHFSTAGSLAEARKVLQKTTPGLMVVDLRLPDGSGMELLPGSREKRNVPIIILTGHGDEEVAAAAIKAGAMDYLVKSAEIFADMPHAIERTLHEWQHITERKQGYERARIEKNRLEVSLILNKMNQAKEQDILDYILEQCSAITESPYCFVGLMSKDESTVHIHAWSRKVMEKCDVEDKVVDFPVATSGIWAEPVRQRKAIIINDLAKAYPQQCVYPQGHVEIRSYLGVPVLELDRIVLLVSVANKTEEYTEFDINGLHYLISDAWQLIKRRRVEESLKKKLDEIERMNLLMVGRELKMEALRKEISRLKNEIVGLRSK